MPSSSAPAGAWSEPYPQEAFDFVSEGLTHTVSLLHDQPDPASGLVEDDRHVDGRQLSEGLRDFAIRRFGLLAPVVLNHWNIHRTDDFGRIVYALIAMNRLKRSERDRIEDFFGVYDFVTAFSDRAITQAIVAIREEESVG
jgi:uncharacterized repeat protein (TIGR04138 family)